MAVQFNTGSLVGQQKKLPLSEILKNLKQTYCGNIGLGTCIITNSEQKHWIMQRFEADLSTRVSARTPKAHPQAVTAAETLERYLHTKYVGQKRFSLEGGESMIAALDNLIQNSSSIGVQRNHHRHGPPWPSERAGEHPGQAAARPVRRIRRPPGGGTAVRRREVPHGLLVRHPHRQWPGARVAGVQPSHLEIVNPVVEGSVRARQQRRGDHERRQVVPVLIHGDAAFGGLGVNQGTFNLSGTRGYGTGGTLHLVVNNQVGFTTSDTRDMRSTLYCTDVAKMVEAPIFHVNGDDPEAVCYVMQAAMEFRMQFKKDVVIDLVCFRKLGHNEGDDPMLTQPMMYKNRQAPGRARQVCRASGARRCGVRRRSRWSDSRLPRCAGQGRAR